MTIASVLSSIVRRGLATTTATTSTMTMTKANSTTNGVGALKTVLVAGGSYAGHEAANVLSQLLPPSYKVVLMERNSHFNHVYAFPRTIVSPGQEHKVFIPYTNVFGGLPSGSRHEYIQATIKSLTLANDGRKGIAEYTREQGDDAKRQSIEFDYLVYALGSHRPASINLWASSSFKGTKKEGIVGLQQAQKAIEQAQKIVVIGAGPLGVEFSGDIAEVYRGTKDLTLISSRTGVLPRLNEEAQQKTLEWLRAKGIKVLLGERLHGEPVEDASSGGKLRVHTNKGSVLEADVVLDCRGLTPNTMLLTSLLGPQWEPTRAARQNAHLQLRSSSSDDDERVFENVYVAGDAGEAFGAHKDGKNARAQAGVASRNIVRQIAASAEDSDSAWAKSFTKTHGATLEAYEPPALRIKVTLGLSDSVGQSDGQSAFRKGEVGSEPNINVEKHWKSRGLSIEDMFV